MINFAVILRMDFETDCREFGHDIVNGQDLFFFMSAVLISSFILLFLPSSSVSLSNLNHAVPMRKCSGEHSCMSSRFPIFYIHTEWYLLFSLNYNSENIVDVECYIYKILEDGPRQDLCPVPIGTNCQQDGEIL